MNTTVSSRLAQWALFMLLAITLGAGAFAVRPTMSNGGQSQAPLDRGQSRPGGDPVPLLLDPRPSNFRAGPPDQALAALADQAAKAPQTASFIIVYIAAGSKNSIGDSCLTFPDQAKPAFTYAASIWGAVLNSPVPITMEACWTSLGNTVLGHAATTNDFKNFSRAPRANTWYQAALANAIAGSDLDPSTPEISAGFSNRSDWYYGTDLNTPSNQINLATVVLHEIGHGLGFAGSMQGSGNPATLAQWGYGTGMPRAYDTFTIDGSGHNLIDPAYYASPSASLLSALTSGAVYFNGPNARAANGGQAVPLYSPSTWAGGSSYSHLAESYNGTANALMTYSVNYGETNYNPGPVALGVLKDLGWGNSSGATPSPTPTYTQPPTITNTPGPTRTLSPSTTPGPYLEVVGRKFTGPLAATPSATATAKATVKPGTWTISGKVTVNGQPVAGIPLQLRFYNAGWGTVATATSASDGKYQFTGLNPPTSGQAYYARFVNDGSTAYSNDLAYWFSKQLSLTNASPGSAQSVEDFDIADISLSEPASGFSTSLPAAFSWTVRPSNPGDSYGVEIIDATAFASLWKVPTVGYVGSTTISSLSSSLSFDVMYGWSVWAQDSQGGYGAALYYREITFLSGLQKAPSQAGTDRVLLRALPAVPEDPVLQSSSAPSPSP